MCRSLRWKHSAKPITNFNCFCVIIVNVMINQKYKGTAVSRVCNIFFLHRAWKLKCTTMYHRTSVHMCFNGWWRWRAAGAMCVRVIESCPFKKKKKQNTSRTKTKREKVNWLICFFPNYSGDVNCRRAFVTSVFCSMFRMLCSLLPKRLECRRLRWFQREDPF